MKNKILRITQKIAITALLPALLLSGCGLSEMGDLIDEDGIYDEDDSEDEDTDHKSEDSRDEDENTDSDSGEDKTGNNNSSEVSYEDVELGELVATMENDEIRDGLVNFSVEMLKSNLHEGENTMVSPISVMYALDLLAAGGEGETQQQILDAMCEGATMDDMLLYAQDFKARLATGDDVSFNIANSVWANEDIVGDVLNPVYMATAQQRLDAQGCVLPFDESALAEINGWVKDETNGMIPSIINQIPEDAAMYLINAIAFEGGWEEEYEEYQINEDGFFINANGMEETAKMLSSTEAYYMETSDATGFIKFYEGKNFAFMAILPKNEELSIDRYVSHMTGNDYLDLINSITSKYDVHTRIPCFTYEYEQNLNESLKNMGIERAFDENAAEFKPIADLGSGNLYVSNVLHKTYIELDEHGTKAAAVTAIEMTANCAMPAEDLNRYVFLDRSFAYAIIDCETMLPIFFGTVNTTK